MTIFNLILCIEINTGVGPLFESNGYFIRPAISLTGHQKNNPHQANREMQQTPNTLIT